MAQFYLGTTPLYRTLLGSTQLNSSRLNEEFIEATGGVITYDGNFKIHTFSTVGSISLNVTKIATVPTNNSIEYLIVGGGGGGGTRQSIEPFNQAGGGGGGAGGLLTGFHSISAIGNYTGSVGDGGLGNIYDIRVGTNGSSSAIFGYTALGGGYGSGEYGGLSPVCYLAASGGSGGGGYVSTGGGACVAGGTGGLGTVGQGNNGGTNFSVNFGDGAAGGGGAGAVGGDSAPAGDGGIGLQSSITGTPTYYAGGGGGSFSGLGGLGGGGNGTGGNGTDGLGGGGGGGGEGYDGGDGGSGVVILRYRFQY